MLKWILILSAFAFFVYMVYLGLQIWGGLNNFGWEVQALVCLLAVGVPLALAAREM